MITVQKGANDLAGASRQVADGVALLVDQTKRMGVGLDQASAFLMAMGQNAIRPVDGGIQHSAAGAGHGRLQEDRPALHLAGRASVRYFIQTDLNPFSTEAMDQVNSIVDTARGAQPNTTLADASISMSGYPVTLRDTRDYYEQDIRLIVAVTVIVVLLILMVLLRAVVAPLYLVGSVIISYLSAVGIGVAVLPGHTRPAIALERARIGVRRVGRGRRRLQHAAGLAACVTSRPRGVRSGVIRTVRSTGGVITAAGLIFAASMFGLLFSSIGTVVQGGFVIGVGILVDTFLVRTITVPAIAALLGRASWWPSRWRPAPGP